MSALHKATQSECLLAEDVHSKQQAGSEFHEDQLVTFLVNTLDEEVALDLGNNAEIDPEDIYEFLVGACADGTSASTLCEDSKDSPR